MDANNIKKFKLFVKLLDVIRLNSLVDKPHSHPSVVLPNGVTRKGKYSITFVGNLFEDDKLAGVSHMYQEATTFHLQNPKLF